MFPRGLISQSFLVFLHSKKVIPEWDEGCPHLQKQFLPLAKRCVSCEGTPCREWAFLMRRAVMCTGLNVFCGHSAYCIQRWHHDGSRGLSKTIRSYLLCAHEDWALTFIAAAVFHELIHSYYWALTMDQNFTFLSAASSRTQIHAQRLLAFGQEVIPLLINNKCAGKALAWKSESLSSSCRSNHDVLDKSTSLSSSFLPFKTKKLEKRNFGFKVLAFCDSGAFPEV